MEWVLIVFVVALIAAPIMWLQPSPRQKRQMALREAARKQGIDVKVATPPLHVEKTAMPGYQWRYPGNAPGPTLVLVRDSHASQALEPFHAGWRWRIAPLRELPKTEAGRLRDLVERLPTDALVIESNEMALTLWWWESQTAERFMTYSDDFARLRDGLKGRADRKASASKA